ncbi:MAG: mechanosensitive ion channel protein MscS [Clostridiales bacterium]|nr:MAG: mechanosensitive ion channel protein MscS [Clostridiales bacterium]
METLQTLLKELVSWATSAGLRLIFCLILLAVGLRLIKWAVRRLHDGKGFSKMEPGLRAFLTSALRITLNALLFLTIAGIMGIPMASFVTVLASCGVAVGLALQGSLGNLAGGVMLLLFHPFRLGDYIETADVSGTVKDISVFYTTLATPDNKTITIPNGNLTNSTITNYSTSTQRRVDLTFGVDYETDMEEMKALLLETARAHPLVLRDPEPFARLSENGDSAMVYSLRVWCGSADYWTVYFDLLEQVKKKLDEKGISIPFPQMDIHTKN